MPPVFWVQRQDIGPSPRSDFGMAYHEARDRVILFGGLGAAGGPLADTWSWDGSLWTQVADTGPSPREGHTLTALPSQQRLVLFGGRYGAGLRADTWAFDGTDWIQVQDIGPSPREGHAAVYDAARQSVLLFGGDEGGTLKNDTWSWDGQSWTQVQDTGPSPRRGHALAFDAVGQRVVLFGGAGAGGAGLSDTWAWDGSTWTQLTDTGPEPRAGMSLNGTASSLVLFGGVSTLEPGAGPAPLVYGDTWEWTAQGWTKVQDIGPAPRFGHGAAVRPGASRLALFGGLALTSSPGAPTARNDTWELPVQTPVQPAPAPSLVSATVNPPMVSVMTPPGTTIATVDVTMSSPPPAGSSVAVSIFSQQGGMMVGVPSILTGPGTFDGVQSTLSVPLVSTPQPLVIGTYGIAVAYGAQSLTAQLDIS